MKQPDLGKKIAELRKAKGLTQEELVETCNLSVRTLQRIEAGEVMPRSYTLKVIFSALEYPAYGSSENTSKSPGFPGGWVRQWLEQLYRYVLDLFNLKTNTMKKLTILSIIIGGIIVGLFALCGESRAQSADKAKRYIVANDRQAMKWINSGQVDSLLTLYQDDACVLPDCYGKESIRRMIVNALDGGYKMREYNTLSVHAEGDLAIEKYDCVFEYQGNVMRQIGLTEWHRKGGKWFIVNDIFKQD